MKLETLYNNEYLKLRDSLIEVLDDVEVAKKVINSCETIICCYSGSTYLKIEWVGFCLHNLMPVNHFYKNEYLTVKEIFKASEQDGYAVEDERLRRLLNLNH